MPTVGDLLPKRSIDQILGTDIMDRKVGGYTPPAPDQDAETQGRIDELVALNRPWTAQAQAEEASKHVAREGTSVKDVFAAGFRANNAGLNAYTWLATRFKDDFDPAFNMRDNQDLLEGIPADMQRQFKMAGSRAGAENIRENILTSLDAERKLADSGLLGTGAALIGGMVDVDSILPLALAGKTARAGAAALKLRGAAKGALEGAAAGMASATVTEPLLAATSPTGDWANVPAGILAAGAFGGTIHAGVAYLSGKRPGLSVEHVEPAPGEHIAALEGEEFSPARVYEPDHLADRANKGMQKMAEELRTAPPIDPIPDMYVGHSVFDKEARGKNVSLSDRAAEFAKDIARKEMSGDGYFSGMAKRFKDALDSSDFADDFNRLFRSDSPTAQALAYTLYESPEGVARNAMSGAIHKAVLTNRGFVPLHSALEEARVDWARTNGFSVVDTHVNGKSGVAFGKEVQLAINDLNYGRKAMTDLHPAIQDAVKAIEKYGDYILKEAKGPHPSVSVPGFEELEKRGIYMHRKWDPKAVRQEARRLGNGDFKKGKDELAGRIAQVIKASDESIDPADAKVFASAIINRMVEKGTGVDMNLKSYLMGDGVNLAREMLEANGVLKEHVDEFLERMTGLREDKGKVGAARNKLPIDIGAQVADTKIIDLMEPDVLDTMMRYNDSLTNRIVLSRNGIKSRDQIEHIKSTILREVSELGDNKTGIDRKFMDYMFSYFDDTPIGEGVHPVIRRLKAATDLAMLNKLGFAQAGETGGIVHSVGTRNFLAASQTYKDFAKGNTDIGRKAVEDLDCLTGKLGYERNLVHQQVLDEARAADLSATGELMNTFDQMLDRGRSAQGILSGYYKIVEMQTDIATKAIANRMFTDMRAGKDLDWKMRDIGLEKYQGRLKALVDDGTIKFNEKWNLDDLGLEKWPDDLKEVYSAALTRHAYQVVQKALPGESYKWMHDSSLSLLTHLKSYPLVAIRKQMIRNMDAGAAEFALLSTYSMATASLCAMVQYAADGKYDKLNAPDIAKRAFGMSNTTGWVPEFYDPIAHLTGLPSFGGGRYGKINMTPPALDTLGRMMHIPQGIAHMGASKEDVRALQSIPLVGNYVGMARVWGAGYTQPEDK